MKEQLSIITSFKGSQDRLSIYTENYKKIFKLLPKGLDIFVNDSSDDRLCDYNKKLFDENLGEGNFVYNKNSFTLLESWVYLLKKIDTPYVLTIFDDQYLHNIKTKTLENYIKFLDNENFDVALFLRYTESRYDDRTNTLFVKNHHLEMINKFKEKEVNIDGQKFCIVNNKNAQFKYSFFVNNAIYKRELLLKQLEFYSNRYKGPKSAHEAELNHSSCPENMRNNKVGVCLSDEIFDLDLGFKHVVGMRQVSPDSFLNYNAIKNNYNIKII